MQLRLSKEIYSLNSIHLAIDAYKEYAKIVIQQDDLYYICNFSDCVNDEGVTIKEFENFLISLHN